MKRALGLKGKGNSSQGLIHGMLYCAMIFVLIAFMSGIFKQSVHAQSSAHDTISMVSIKEGDEWTYFKGVQKPPRKWNQSGFDDSQWLKGTSGFGYGHTSISTHLGDMMGNYSTVYARKEFTVDNIYTVTGMTMTVICDGPFTAYLNGMKVIRSKSVRQRSQQSEKLDISGFAHELFPGSNQLSVQCSNDDVNSDDFSFIPYFEVLEYQGGDR
jgi:hypothetical protein